MAKKADKTVKPGRPAKADRWTVRGVPARLQKAAGDAARARGLTLGQWLSEALTAALPRTARAPAQATERWEETIERRLARLEAAVLQDEAAKPGAVAAVAVRPSGHVTA